MKTLPSAIFFDNLKRVRNAICAFAAALVLGTAMFAATPSIAEEIQLGRDVSKLPPEVQRMRQAILQAAMSGDIEELRIPIDMNELHPIFSKDRTPDPIALPEIGFGRRQWPGDARHSFQYPHDRLRDQECGDEKRDDRLALSCGHSHEWTYPEPGSRNLQVLAPARVKEMAAAGRYSFYSVGMGRDGVWHYFSRD